MANVFDPIVELVSTLVATPPSPPSSGTTVTVTAGQGSLFPDPSILGAYNLCVCPAGSQPTIANAEYWRVTTRVGDVMTITRAQGPTSARTVLAGDRVFMPGDAKKFADLQKLISAEGTAVSTTGNITSLALPGGFGVQVTKMTNASLATIQGMAAGLYTGQRWIIRSEGAGQVDLSHHDAGATGAQLTLFATTGKTSLAAGVGTAEFIYDGSKWRLTAHEQGDWITPTFSAGDYTASAGTWTVISGNVQTCAYFLRGRKLTVQMEIVSTTVSTTPAGLRRAIPGGFTATAAFRVSQMALVNDNAGGFIPGEMQSVASATVMSFSKLAGNWSASTTSTSVFGLFDVAVQ